MTLGQTGRNAARQVLEQTGVEQSVPRPRVGDWWQEVAARFMAFVAELLNLDSATVKALLTVVAWAVIAVAGLSLLMLIVRAFRRSHDDQQRESLERVQPTETATASSSSQYWKEKLDEALAANDLRGAIEALWFVVASRLNARAETTSSLGTGVSSMPDWSSRVEWTGRKLLALAGALKPHLTPTVRALERATYSESRPSMDDLLALRFQIDELLPEGGVSESGTSQNSRRRGR